MENLVAIDAEKFGATVAHVDNLRSAVGVLDAKMDSMDKKLDILILESASRKGADAVKKRWAHAASGIVAALVAGVTTWMIDQAKH